MTIDKLLCNIIEESSRSKTLAVFLSGGVDSNSLAFAAHRLGKKVVAYTFHLEGTPSYDPKKAETISEAIGWKCNTIQVPTNKVADDFLRLRNEYHCVKKTQYECTFPFLYIYPQVSEREILTGFAADGHYGLSRKAIEPSKANVTASKTNFDKFRDVYFTQKNIAPYNQQILLANRFKKKLISPYLDARVIEFFKTYDWNELNKPRQKEIVRQAFAKEFGSVPHISQHRNLQLEAGVNLMFKTKLIHNVRINSMGRTRVMDICRDWAK